jgi:hypothetical protein
MVIILIVISGHFINGYWWLNYHWLLVVIILMAIVGYSIIGNWWVILIVAIDDYYIVGY